MSICTPWPARTRRPTPRSVSSCTTLTRWLQGAPEAIKLPDDQGIALA